MVEDMRFLCETTVLPFHKELMLTAQQYFNYAKQVWEGGDDSAGLNWVGLFLVKNYLMQICLIH